MFECLITHTINEFYVLTKIGTGLHFMTSLRSKSIDKRLKDAYTIMTHTKLTIKNLNFKHNFYLIWALNKKYQMLKSTIKCYLNKRTFKY